MGAPTPTPPSSSDGPKAKFVRVGESITGEMLIGRPPSDTPRHPAPPPPKPPSPPPPQPPPASAFSTARPSAEPAFPPAGVSEKTPYVGTLGPFRDAFARQSAAPAGIAPVTVAPAATATAAPAGTPVPFPVTPAGSTPPAPDTGSRPVYAAPAPVSTGLAWIRAVTLLMKLLPVALVLGGAYYFYSSMFGKMSPEEMAAAGLNAPGGPAGEGKSRAQLMIGQTKAVVAAQSRHVEFANRLAEQDAEATEPGAAPAPKAPVVAAPPPPPVPELKPAPAAPAATYSIYAPSGSPRDIVFLGTPASPALIQWTRNLRLSGVRGGVSEARAMINDIVYRTGETVDHSLKIILDGVDSTERTVIFRDAGGTVIAHPY